MPTLSISVMGKFQADDEGKEHVSRIDSGGRHGKGGVVGCHQAGSCKCSPPTSQGALVQSCFSANGEIMI